MTHVQPLKCTTICVPQQSHRVSSRSFDGYGWRAVPGISVVQMSLNKLCQVCDMCYRSAASALWHCIEPETTLPPVVRNCKGRRGSMSRMFLATKVESPGAATTGQSLALQGQLHPQARCSLTPTDIHPVDASSAVCRQVQACA